MSDKDVLDRARLLFIGGTQGDKLAREVVDVAERTRPRNVLPGSADLSGNPG